MYQTEYKELQTFSKSLLLEAGFCAWYYTPRQNIDYFPAIDPVTQYLGGEPTLITDAVWYGPVKVPSNLLGFDEQLQRTRAGIYYRQKVSGFYPGDGASSRTNLENIAYHEMVIVAKVRAGGFWMVLGNKNNGFSFENDFTGGNATLAAGSKFGFSGESVNKGLVLLSFSGLPADPPPDEDGITITGSDNKNQTEVIKFTGVSTVAIDWNDTRKNKFGIYPEIQVWYIDSETGAIQLANTQIYCDAQPPDTTTITINNAGSASGFVVLK